jgi:hypothetical protein
MIPRSVMHHQTGSSLQIFWIEVARTTVRVTQIHHFPRWANVSIPSGCKALCKESSNALESGQFSMTGIVPPPGRILDSVSETCFGNTPNKTLDRAGRTNCA